LDIYFDSKPIFNQLPDRPLAHCATLAVLPDGTLLSAWFGGSFETASDVAILASECKPSMGEWSPPRVIAQVADHALGQPVFLVRPNNELWLFFDVIMGGASVRSASFNAMPSSADWKRAQPFLQKSTDGGKTWETPAQLFDYPGLMFRSRPMVLPGRILFPVYDENTWQSRMMITEDDARSWRLTGPIISPRGNIHACLVRLRGDGLLAYMRTGGQGGVIWRAESCDGGETWSKPTATNLPNPNSGIDLLRLASGALVLAYNPSDHARTPLCVALADQDEDWRWQRTLENAPAEFSYPTLTQTSDGQIQLVYTYQREHIQSASFSEGWLREAIQ
jgi:predicted neuraminidase